MKKVCILLYFFALSSTCCLGQENDSDCGNLESGSIAFKGSVVKLNAPTMPSLKKLAKEMRANPNCNVVIAGTGSGGKLDQQHSWDRVNNTINYLVDKEGIDRDRFIFRYGVDGMEKTVLFRAANSGENGPSRVPPPFPNLSR